MSLQELTLDEFSTSLQLTIPKEAFDSIRKELERRPLQTNEYRKQTGVGKSQAFGVVNRRCMPPDYSRWCWKRPYLYKLLLDFAEQYVPIPFNAITVNQNYRALAHRDNHNVGDSFLVAFGEYQGGRLLIHEGDLSGAHNICYKPIVYDFSKHLHSVEPFTGTRFSLVFYNFALKGKIPCLPIPNIQEENGRFVFYRGSQRIDPNEGLPHPKRGKTTH